MKYILIVACLFMQIAGAGAQEISFRDTVHSFNRQRIRTNVNGAYVLGSWGLANVAVGGIGYFNAQQDEWKYFHGMNAAWGVINTFIAAGVLERSRRQLHQRPDFEQSYKRYKTDKRHYLISSCFDVVYIGAGIAMTRYADNSNNPDLFNGFGKSIALQGAFLLVFDNVMYAAQMRANTRWRRIMGEIHVANNGMGFSYNF